jgi:DNA-binding XRE family transcriptional regulator
MPSIDSFSKSIRYYQRHTTQTTATSASARRYRVNVRSAESLPLRRLAACDFLIDWHNYGNVRDLERFVATVGNGGTFDGDFIVISSIPRERRLAHERQCMVCKRRRPRSAFDENKHQFDGLAHICRDCADERNTRWWFSGSQVFSLRGSSKPETIHVSVFSHRVRSLRQARGWSQASLAAKCGLSARQIRRLENGGHRPHAGTIQQLARAFEISAQDMVIGAAG